MIYIWYNGDVFLEIAEALHECLTKLNIDNKVITYYNHLFDNDNALYIVIGLNNTTKYLPKKYIAYQLEQTGNEKSWFTEDYLNKLRKAMEIWDYSSKNIQNCKKIAGLMPSKFVPLGYADCLCKIKRPIMPVLPNESGMTDNGDGYKYDVLFYGSDCPRRYEIVESLRRHGLKVFYGKYNIWNTDRDDIIANTKIVLNIHYYPNPILETTRISYLVNNGIFVISENSLDVVLDKMFENCVVFSKYENIVQLCKYYIEHESERLAFAQNAQQIFKTKYPFIKSLPSSSLIYNNMYNHHLGGGNSLPNDICLITEDDDGCMNGERMKDKEKRNEKGNEPESELDAYKKKLALQNKMLGDLDSKSFRAAEVDETEEGMILRLSDVAILEKNAPKVSLIVPTARRSWAIPMILKNFYSFTYPANKLELIILDSNPTEKISLPQDNRIIYQIVDDVPIWVKRNMAVARATGSIIVHLDDDDYYFEDSVWAKVKLLTKYGGGGIRCVGCTDLGVYHLMDNYSYLSVKGKCIAEASMAYTKSFWQEHPFTNKYSEMGEGYDFVKGRENQVLTMPYMFNMIAMTHKYNVTKALRTNPNASNNNDGSQYDNFFNLFDRQTQLFLLEIRNKLNRIG